MAAAAVFALFATAGCGRGSGPSASDEINVLLVVIDTAGAEHMGYELPDLGHTPNIDRLARDGVLFTRAYSPAPWTQPAVASLFTSRMPSRHGVLRLFDVLDEEHTTMAEWFEERGFRTAGVISHMLLESRYGYAQGFESWDATPVGGHDAITSHAVTDRAIRWLDRHDRSAPFFLFVHYFDPHFAYWHHPEFRLTGDYRGPVRPGMGIWELREAREQLGPEDLRYLVALYREEIAYTDHHIGRLLDHLRRRQLDGETLVIVTADHGEEFMRHGWIGHTRTLYDELLRVPFVMRLPGGPEGRVVETPVSLLDVLPTLMALAGEPADPAAEGRSLLPWLGAKAPAPAARELRAEVSFASRPEDPAALSQKTAFKTAWLRPDLKLIHDLVEDRFELYDRSTDPEELRDLSGAHPAEAELRAELLAWERTREARGVERPGLQPSPEELERLRALGYLR